jgi:hypothetical protein
VSYTPAVYTCDECGKPATSNEVLTLEVTTSLAMKKTYPNLAGYLAHYHADCWGAVLRDIRTAIKGGDAEDTDDGASAPPAEKKKWKNVSIPEREALLHQALGDRRRTTSELAEKMSELWGATVYTAEAAALVARMWKAGLLAREPEPFKGQVRYRYFHPAELSGTIAELEQAFGDHDMSEGA